MGCASVLAVWDLVWVILGWKWSRVPQPSVRHSHNFKSIKSSFHKQHLDCQRQARRANGRANANATTSRRSVTHIYYINWAVKNQMNSTKRRENVRKKSPKREVRQKNRGERGPVTKAIGWLVVKVTLTDSYPAFQTTLCWLGALHIY